MSEGKGEGHQTRDRWGCGPFAILFWLLLRVRWEPLESFQHMSGKFCSMS